VKPLISRSVKLDSIDEKLELLADKGIFLLGGPIDISSLAGLLTGILPRWSSEKKQIWVILNSPGGDIYQGLAVHDFLKALVEQGIGVNIVGTGMVASMAVCIMQAATKRYSFPNTQFTVHQASLSGEGDPQEVNQLVENAKELVRLNEIVLNIIAERSGMDVNRIMDLSKKTDYSIGASRAKEFGKNGLIDEIITTFPFSING